MPKTEGLLLKRQALSTYDERLHFYLADRGFFSLHSFGSRSPKSRRAAALSRLALFELHYEQAKNKASFELKSLDIVEDFLPSFNEERYRMLAGMIEVLERMKGRVQESDLIQLFGNIQCTCRGKEKSQLILLLAVLAIEGQFPYPHEKEKNVWSWNENQYIGLEQVQGDVTFSNGEIRFLRGFYDKFETSMSFFSKCNDFLQTFHPERMSLLIRHFYQVFKTL